MGEFSGLMRNCCCLHSFTFSGRFQNFSREERQQKIFQNYKFKCDCDACLKDFPLLDDLPEIDAEFQAPLFKINQLSAEEAIEEFKANCEYIAKNFAENFPSNELALLEDRNEFLLRRIAQFSVLIGNIPVNTH